MSIQKEEELRYVDDIGLSKGEISINLFNS